MKSSRPDTTEQPATQPETFHHAGALFHGAARGLVPSTLFGATAAGLFTANEKFLGPRFFKIAAGLIAVGVTLNAANEYSNQKDKFDERQNKQRPR